MKAWMFEEDPERVRYGYAINQVLYSGKSKFQSIDIVDTVVYGKALFLDGMMMLTEKDEFVYHEMISHVPVAMHRDPKTVLVIGGGDGGTVRELCRYSGIERITLCEIDGDVVDLSKEFFPDVASGFSDPRVDVKIGDGIAYMQECTQDFDIIIIDSTDPVGPGEGLFTKSFYESVRRALKPGGVMVAQAESPWYEKKFLERIYANISSAFPCLKPYTGSIPTYPTGMWSWVMASAEELDPRQLNEERWAQVASHLHYLTPSRIAGAFELPPFFRDKISAYLKDS